ncbi:tetratricopeptide repeat protein [Streptomyces sp. NBC_01803]|uniref:tetratricopeptide repeat protein n=1 Tax=Streptomyces sp. NBC_01803 TaxID=2975946 RepID=UPI002DDBF2D7|nr:tetratricopeptide repeat protein [Streptomyces sp. NBC_01803]WSA47750.1 tetratricopeptide repeat protein [Streptomyces sp. NBC_01803]
MTEQTVTGGSRRPGFLGRHRELSILRADVERAGLDTLAGRPAARGRVLLVAGRPGTGRTTLAEEFAAELVAGGDYPDGVLRARLTDPDGTPVPTGRTVRALLAGLGADGPPGAGDDELTDVLRETLQERRAVLLLDDVGTAEQLVELIPDTRHCLVLAVARGPLTGVPDVRPCTLGGLDRTAAALLVERGAGDVRVTVDPGATESLAEACGCLPAALTLAAGWLAAHPEAAVADAVRRMRAAAAEDYADLAAPDTADEPLRRALLLVHGVLPAPAARLLRLLPLAPAGLVDAHTAAALAGCPLGAARDTLADLAAYGLLRPDGSGGSGGSDGERRYLVPGCLDPLLRALLNALEKPSEALLARARMLERTVRLLRACQAVTEPEGSPAREWLAGLPVPLRFGDRADATRWLASRQPALLAASRLAVADGRLDTLARRLVSALSRALIAHHGAEGAAPELYALHELVLDVAERQDLPRERAAALLNLADLDAGTGRLTDALDRYRAALEAARSERDGEQPAVGRALESIAGTYGELGDWQRAADWYGRAVALAQSRDDLAAQARLQGRIGAALTHAGQWPEALRAWRAAGAAHRRLGDVSSYARALAETARVHEHAGRAEEALRTGAEALRLAEGTGDRRLQAAFRLRLAECADRLGRTAVAAVHRQAAERLLALAGTERESSATTEGQAYETQTASVEE